MGITKEKGWFVYEVFNKENSRTYVGVRKITGTSDDSTYLGSGKAIKAAVLRYGRDSFTRTIMEYFDNEDAAYAYERQIVDKDYVRRSDTYNLTEGGRGGDRFTIHPDRESYRSKLRDASIRGESHKHFGDCSGEKNGFYGKKHTKENLERIKEQFAPSNHPRSHRVTFRGVAYPSLRAAERATGMNHHKLKKLGLRKL